MLNAICSWEDRERYTTEGTLHFCPNFLSKLQSKHKLPIVSDRLQQHITMLKMSFPIHAIDDYTFLTSGVFEVQRMVIHKREKKISVPYELK